MGITSSAQAMKFVRWQKSPFCTNKIRTLINEKARSLVSEVSALTLWKFALAAVWWFCASIPQHAIRIDRLPEISTLAV
jgi:hypothetical protein